MKNPYVINHTTPTKRKYSNLGAYSVFAVLICSMLFLVVSSTTETNNPQTWQITKTAGGEYITKSHAGGYFKGFGNTYTYPKTDVAEFETYTDGTTYVVQICFETPKTTKGRVQYHEMMQRHGGESIHNVLASYARIWLYNEFLENKPLHSIVTHTNASHMLTTHYGLNVLGCSVSTQYTQK